MRERWDSMSGDLKLIVKLALLAIVPTVGFGIRTHVALSNIRQDIGVVQAVVSRNNDAMLLVVDDNTEAINNNSRAMDRLVIYLERTHQIDEQALIDPDLQLKSDRRNRRVQHK